MNFPDLEPEELTQNIGDTCSLDVADRGDTTLDRCGELMNVTRERIRQIEVASKVELERRLIAAGVDLGED